MAGIVQQQIERELLRAAQAIEDEVDNQLKSLDHMEEDDLEKIRQRRIDQMKHAQKKKQEYLAMGHGEYSEIDEKQFFDVVKKSERVVVHFYRTTTFRCKILDKHLAILARKHIETRFVRLDAEKANFLVEKLKIWMLPSLACIKNGQAVDYVVGFDDLGGKDDFSTNLLAKRLAKPEILTYNGDVYGSTQEAQNDAYDDDSDEDF